jgi:alpha-D-xyloside xylohydrolase
MMRAMLLEFPNDLAGDMLDRQYMLGSSLLVAPVFSGEGYVSYYLPAGRWTNFLTGEVVEGPGWKQELHGFMSLPLLVRPNSVIPVGRHDDKPDYDYTDGVTLQVYELADGAVVKVAIPTLKGETSVSFEVKRTGNTITVEPKGAMRPWNVLVVGKSSAASVSGGTTGENSKGLLVRSAKADNQLVILLQ